jgi:arginine utilization regulatory protein
MNYKNILETYVRESNEGLIITDINANIVFFKESNNITGARLKNPVGKNILEVFPYISESTSTFYRVLKSQTPIINRVQSYKNMEGKKVSVVTSTIPIIEDGKFIGAFEIFKDLTLVAELSEEVLTLQKRINNVKQISKKDNGTKYTFNDFKGESTKINLLKNNAKKIATSSSPILVYGETGTGKELLVQAIHNEDHIRRDKVFIAQNCAALPQNLLESILFGTEEGCFTGAKNKMGLFEVANGGTIFLDEINSMDITLQGKLLRVLQESEIRRIGAKETKLLDVRIIASTNEHPQKLLREGRLREDLYYRLNVIYLEIPPLRERKDDIDPLVEFFISKYNNRLHKNVASISNEVAHMFHNYAWKGNVRELQHCIESAMNWCEGNVIQKEHINLYDYEENIYLADSNISINYISEKGLNETLDEYERNIILKAIEHTEGNYSKAARYLKIPKQTLQNKIKKYEIKKKIIME